MPEARLLLRRKIKDALDYADIEGLLATGCPADEYDVEASLIEARIANAMGSRAKNLDTAEVQDIVADVWNGQFGPFSHEDMEKRRAGFASAAKHIVAATQAQ